MRVTLAAAAAAATLLAGCSGAGKTLLPATPAASATPSGSSPVQGTSRASLTVVVPRAGTSPAMRRRPAYVSPSSSILGVAVIGATATTYGLTLNSPGCAVIDANLSCTVSIVAPPGNDAFALTLGDGAGHILSRNVVSVKIASGTSTPVSVTLAGVPASVAVVPGAGAIVDSSTQPFHTPGLFAVPVEIEALDADGNVIVGPGSPTVLSVAIASGGSYAQVAPAAGTDPFAYVLTPSGGSAGGKTVTLTATVRGIPLADGTTSAPVASSTSYLFTPALAVGSGPRITVYSIESTAVVAEFFACGGACGGNSVDDLAANANGDLAVDVAQFTGSLVTSVHEIPSGTTGAATVLGASEIVHSVGGVAFDKNGLLYSANGNTGSSFGGTHLPPSITEYAYGATSPKYKIANTFAAPGGVVVDRSGNVYESDPNNTLTIVRYPPASGTVAATYSDPSLAEPTRMAIGASGGLYVADGTNDDIAYFAPNQTALTTTLTDSSFANGIDALLVDPSGNLWVSLGNGNEIERLDAGSLPNSVVITGTLPQNGFMGWIP